MSRKHHTSPITVALATVALVLVMGGSPAGASQHQTWHLTNILNEHGTTHGPDHRMADGANGTFPTGYLLVVSPGAFSVRTWSAPVAGRSFAQRTWTIEFGGRSAIVNLAFAVGSYDPATRAFTPAPGPHGEVGVTRTGTFTPTSNFVVAPGQRLGLQVWDAGDTATPSLLDVWDAAGGPSPSSLEVV